MYRLSWHCRQPDKGQLGGAIAGATSVLCDGRHRKGEDMLGHGLGDPWRQAGRKWGWGICPKDMVHLNENGFI